MSSISSIAALLPIRPRPDAEAGASALVESASAKVNLYLHIVGRRDDGYHLLDSLVAFAAVGDVITAAPAGALTLLVNGPFAAALRGEPDNLVLRAAQALASSTNINKGASIALTKNLPLASGIGGGSADAAAILRVLCRLWGIAPESVPLEAIARDLGADVPVCLDGVASFVGGIGEQRERAPALPAAGMVLVNPGIPLATPAVFARRSGPFAQAARFTIAPRDAADLAELLRARGNDLTAPAVALVPEIKDVLAALAGSPACLLARMSGSGATCFGLYADEAAARSAASWLSTHAPSWWVAATRLVHANSEE